MMPETIYFRAFWSYIVPIHRNRYIGRYIGILKGNIDIGIGIGFDDRYQTLG